MLAAERFQRPIGGIEPGDEGQRRQGAVHARIVARFFRGRDRHHRDTDGAVYPALCRVEEAGRGAGRVGAAAKILRVDSLRPGGRGRGREAIPPAGSDTTARRLAPRVRSRTPPQGRPAGGMGRAPPRESTRSRRFALNKAATALRFYCSGAVCAALVTPGGSSMIRRFLK